MKQAEVGSGRGNFNAPGEQRGRSRDAPWRKKQACPRPCQEAPVASPRSFITRYRLTTRKPSFKSDVSGEGSGAGRALQAEIVDGGRTSQRLRARNSVVASADCGTHGIGGVIIHPNPDFRIGADQTVNGLC